MGIGQKNNGEGADHRGVAALFFGVGRNWLKAAQAWTEGDGDCMQSSANLMMRWKYRFMPGGAWEPGGEPTLVHALVYGRGSASGHRFPHAWVEVGSMVYDHSNGVERALPRELYYAIGGVDHENSGAYRRYSFEEMRKKLLSEGNYGPWDLDEGLEEKPRPEKDTRGGSGKKKGRKDGGGDTK